jgi:mono/diheme cytochrome c family protein
VRRAPLLIVLLVVVPAASAQPPAGVLSTHVKNAAGLYAANCATCHGSKGEGIAPPGVPGTGGIIGMGPSLRNVGAGTADFYIRTG